MCIVSVLLLPVYATRCGFLSVSFFWLAACPVKPRCFFCSVQGNQQGTQMLSGLGSPGMQHPKSLLTDRQGALIEGYCFLHVPLLTTEACQALEDICCPWMVLTQRLLPDVQGSLVQYFGLLVSPLLASAA